MTVSQRMIDLLNAPMPTLRKMARARELPVSNVRKWELASALSRLSREELEQGAEGYLYAGSTSLSWIRFVPANMVIEEDDLDAVYPLRGEELPADRVPDVLRAHSEGDAFSETSRPDDITEMPKLIVAREWDDGYILTFGIAKRIGHVIHNFEDIPILEDEFFTGYLRPRTGTIEVRASTDRARKLERTWLGDFLASFDLKPLPVAITTRDYVALHRELDARLDVYLGRTTTGTTIFETHRFTKADGIADMLTEDEFDRATADLETVSLDLLFDMDDVGEIRVHVSVLKGSIFIRTAVPERVVRYVYDVLDRIKSRYAGP